MDKKVTVVGAGNVGATVAQRLAERELADVVLLDRTEGLAQGKALDLQEAASVEKYDVRLIGADAYEASEGSDVVILAAGVPRKPGMSRGDLLATNAKIVKDIVEQAAPLSPDAILIIVTNPLDAMCHVAFQTSKFPRNRVVGMSGVLDAGRLCTFIAMELNVSVKNTHALVLGGHGKTMVPLPRYSTVAGVPITELLRQERVDALVKRTRDGGAEIIGLLEMASAYYAPASAVVEMADSVLKDKKKVLPCAAYLQGEYGIHDLFIGVPVKLGKDGVEEIVKVILTDEERAALKRSADAVRCLVESLDKMEP
jgi:malate dehydrogenase